MHDCTQEPTEKKNRAQQQLGEDPRSGALFCYVNKRFNRLKILWWGAPGEAWSWRRGQVMGP